MALIEAETQAAASGQSGHARLIAGAAIAGAVLLMGAAVLLWINNGTAVFFETLAAGVAACF